MRFAVLSSLALRINLTFFPPNEGGRRSNFIWEIYSVICSGMSEYTWILECNLCILGTAAWASLEYIEFTGTPIYLWGGLAVTTWMLNFSFSLSYLSSTKRNSLKFFIVSAKLIGLWLARLSITLESHEIKNAFYLEAVQIKGIMFFLSRVHVAWIHSLQVLCEAESFSTHLKLHLLITVQIFWERSFVLFTISEIAPAHKGTSNQLIDQIQTGCHGNMFRQIGIYILFQGLKGKKFQNSSIRTEWTSQSSNQS